MIASAGRIVIVCLAVVASASAGPNLLQNPGFEEGPSGCSTIGLHWDAPEDGCQPSVQALVTNEKHAGTWSQRLGPSTDTDFGWIRQVTNYNTISAGKTYRISAWIKSTVTDGWGWNVFRAEALNNDSTLFHINMPQQATPDYDWREITWDYEVTDPSVNRLGAALTRHWQNGYAWYDDVSISEVVAGPPTIDRSPSSFTRVVVKGQVLTDDSFTVRNSGGGTLNYQITDDAGWLSEVPASGTSDGETDILTVEYSYGALAVGVYGAVITIADPAASNTPETIAVTLTVRQAGDFDLDGDVDQDDFGRFQACLSGAGFAYTGPDCEWGNLDGDVDVDQDDYQLFEGCMSGANVPAAPDCAG